MNVTNPTEEKHRHPSDLLAQRGSTTALFKVHSLVQSQACKRCETIKEDGCLVGLLLLRRPKMPARAYLQALGLSVTQAVC